MNNSSKKNPTEMLERYLQAVRFWLPKAQQEDILAELSEDLRSQIDEKETELGRPLNEAELGSILKKCGSPMRVASRFQPGQHLIGPAWFPVYRFVLKLVLLWILIPVFLVIVGPATMLTNPNHGAAVLQTLGGLWTALLIAGGVITLIFAIMERVQVQCEVLDKWDPRSLPPLVKREQIQSGTKSVCEVAFGVLGLMWLLIAPQYPFLVFGPAAAFLKLGPLWHQFYLPIILLTLAGLAHQLVSLARPQWTLLPPIGRLLTTGLGLVLLNFVIKAATPTPNGDWHPFVVLAQAVHNSAQYNRIAAIVNVMILISLAAAWLGLCIAGTIQTWEFLQLVRKRMLRPPAAAPSRAA
jgi:hypothetical protein